MSAEEGVGLWWSFFQSLSGGKNWKRWRGAGCARLFLADFTAMGPMAKSTPLARLDLLLGCANGEV